jgi:hypothetical protein
VRIVALALIGLLTRLDVAGARRMPRDDEAVTFRCRDGQKPTEVVPCDIDARVDGTCTFGERGGKRVEVRVGESVRTPNSCGVVGPFICAPARRAEP